jgi:predicted glycosyltransferase
VNATVPTLAMLTKNGESQAYRGERASDLGGVDSIPDEMASASALVASSLLAAFNAEMELRMSAMLGESTAPAGGTGRVVSGSTVIASVN